MVNLELYSHHIDIYIYITLGDSDLFKLVILVGGLEHFLFFKPFTRFY